MTERVLLCDPHGMTNYNHMGKPYRCTGSMHLGTELIMCSNPIHEIANPQRINNGCMIYRTGAA